MTRITQSGPGIPGPASDDRRGSASSFAPARGRRPTRSQRSCLRKATRVSARSLRRVGGSRARGLAFIHTRPIPRCGSASGSNRSHRNDRRLSHTRSPLLVPNEKWKRRHRTLAIKVTYMHLHRQSPGRPLPLLVRHQQWRSFMRRDLEERGSCRMRRIEQTRNQKVTFPRNVTYGSSIRSDS